MSTPKDKIGTIPKTLFRIFWNKIPVTDKRLCAKQMGYPATMYITNRRFFFEHELEFVKTFIEQNDYESPNTVGETAEFDYDQVHQYLKGLTDFIGSREFGVLPKYAQIGIINEQKQIFKQVES